MTAVESGRRSQGLLRHATIYIAAAALNAAIPFGILPLIARWLGPADFGIVGSYVALVNVLILLIGLNAYGFVGVGYYRDGPELLPRLAGAAFLIIATTTAIAGVAVWIGADFIVRASGISRHWIWALPATAAGQALIAVSLAVAQTIQRPILYGIVQIGYGLTLATLAILLIGGIGMGWPGRVMAQAVAALMVGVGGFIWLAATGRVTLRVGREMLHQALGFGVPLLPHTFAAVAMASMDRLALKSHFPPEVVGHYFLALQIASSITAFAAAVNQAWVPWLYARLARNDDTSWTEIASAIRIGGLFLVVGAIALSVSAGPIVMVVGGPSFATAAASLRFLAFYAACQAWYTLMAAFLFYAKRPKLLSSLTVSAALVQASLIAALLRWGAVGVSAALMVTALIGAIAISIVARRYALDHRENQAMQRVQG